MSVAENLSSIREALKAYPHVQILGAAKAQPRERVREAIAAGLKIIGNNYVQEGQALMEELAAEQVEWHFIGHIQSRKAKELVGYSCVESLDRFEIAEILSRRLEGQASPSPNAIFVEVNVGGEDSKSGVLEAQLDAFCEKVAALPGIRLAGLMSLVPPRLPVEERRTDFAVLRKAFERLKPIYGFTTLSMGTSEDYVIAASEGATLVRLGSVLFGDRPKKA